MLFLLEAATVLALLHIRPVATVLHGDHFTVGRVGAHGARERQELKRFRERDLFEQHCREERRRPWLLVGAVELLEGADLHIGTEPSGLREDVHPRFRILPKNAPFAGHLEELHRLVEREFIRRHVVGDRGRGVLFFDLAVALLDVGTKLADSNNYRLAVFGHAERNGVDEARIDLGETARNLLFQTRFTVWAALTEVEAGEPRLGLFGAGCDLVEVVFHLRGKRVVDEVREVTFHHVGDGEGRPRRNEGGTLLPDVAAVLNRSDDRCVGRRAPNTNVFQTLHERGLGKARWRLRFVALEDQWGGRDSCVALFERRQAALVVGVGVFGAALLLNGLFINLAETAMLNDRARGVELHVLAAGTGGAQPQLHGFARAIGHLRGNRALPDQLIHTSFRDRHFAGHSIGQHKRIAGGADGLVSLLRVLRLLRVEARRIGQEVLAITLRDHRTGGLQRGVGQRGAVGTHVGDVALFVETLRRSHRHRRGKAKLVARFLLEGGGDERSGRATAVGLRPA